MKLVYRLLLGFSMIGFGIMTVGYVAALVALFTMTETTVSLYFIGIVPLLSYIFGGLMATDKDIENDLEKIMEDE